MDDQCSRCFKPSEHLKSVFRLDCSGKESVCPSCIKEEMEAINKFCAPYDNLEDQDFTDT